MFTKSYAKNKNHNLGLVKIRKFNTYLPTHLFNVFLKIIKKKEKNVLKKDFFLCDAKDISELLIDGVFFFNPSSSMPIFS